MRGNNNRQITKNTNVLKKDSIADNLPLDKAVKNAVVKTPIPLKRKLNENNLKPFKAILYASVSAGAYKLVINGAPINQMKKIKIEIVKIYLKQRRIRR